MLFAPYVQQLFASLNQSSRALYYFLLHGYANLYPATVPEKDIEVRDSTSSSGQQSIQLRRKPSTA